MANWQVHYSNKIAICTSIFYIPSQGVNTPYKTQVTSLSLPPFPFGFFPFPSAIKYVNSEIQNQFYFPFIALKQLPAPTEQCKLIFSKIHQIMKNYFNSILKASLIISLLPITSGFRKTDRSC